MRLSAPWAHADPGTPLAHPPPPPPGEGPALLADAAPDGAARLGLVQREQCWGEGGPGGRRGLPRSLPVLGVPRLPGHACPRPARASPSPGRPGLPGWHVGPGPSACFFAHQTTEHHLSGKAVQVPGGQTMAKAPGSPQPWDARQAQSRQQELDEGIWLSWGSGRHRGGARARPQGTVLRPPSP